MSKEILTPFRFRNVGERLLVTNDAGNHDFFEKTVVQRFFEDRLTNSETRQFRDLSLLVDEKEKWRLYSLARRTRSAVGSQSGKLNYLILIPTLRCDLSCSYCQVSRAPLKAKGYDWTADTLRDFKSFVQEADLGRVKIEFQGGEPTLRPDLLQEIIDICIEYSQHAEFVICSNIVNLSDAAYQIISRDDVFVSTSIDGNADVMTKNRTEGDQASNQVFDNFQRIVKDFGKDKIAALPTITEAQLDNPGKLIELYAELGFSGIFLRPVNYQGFARKAYSELSNEIDRWNTFYEKAMEHILRISQDSYFEEFYLAHLVRNIFSKENSGFVDFRSPSWFADEYCVIDFDGKIYPSDESRMLSRLRQVDLCIGDLNTGIDRRKVSDLNHWGVNQTHEDCIHCAYMPYCGIDLIDDISRYGRFDIIKKDSWFCSRQIFLYDFIFSKIESNDRDWMNLFLKWLSRKESGGKAYEVFQ